MTTSTQNTEKFQCQTTRFIPATDISESKEAMYLHVDLPGVNKESLEIKVEKNMLEVHGKTIENPFPGFKVVHREYREGDFTRKFSLSNEIDQDKIEAKLVDGVLSLTLPKLQDIQPKSILIN